MKDSNNDLKQDVNNLNTYKTKYFFIGFIIGIIPYIILIIVTNNFMKLPNLIYLKKVLIIIGICTAFINAFILQNKVNRVFFKFEMK